MKFLEKTHTYLNDDGIIIPSVTQLISWKFGSGYEDVPKKILEAKAAYGTRIHALIEEYCKTAGGQESDRIIVNYGFCRHGRQDAESCR